MGVDRRDPGRQTPLTELAAYKKAEKGGDRAAAATALKDFNGNRQYLGYGYLKTPRRRSRPSP